MTDLDPDIDWVALLESQGAGPEKYHMHANAHAMACQKYTVAAQQAKLSGNGQRASLLRKIGKKHKLVSDTLAAIANDHVGATYSIQMKKKAQLMPKKKPVNENLEDISEDILDEELELEEGAELEEIDEELSPVRTLIACALVESPLVFQNVVSDILGEIVSEQLGDLKQRLQEALAADSDDSDEDSEEDSKESLQSEDTELDEISKETAQSYLDKSKAQPSGVPHQDKRPFVKALQARTSKRVQGRRRAEERVTGKKIKPNTGFGESYRYATTEPGPEGHKTVAPMGQEHLSEPTGKKFPTGRQEGDANTLPKLGTKKKSQKGTTVAAGDTVRTQRAVD